MTQVDQKIITPDMLRELEFRLYDVGAERAMLSCIIKKPQLIIEAERLVKPEWMYHQLNEYVYRIMLWMYRECMRNNWALRFDSVTMLAACNHLGPAYVENFMKKTDGMEQVRSIENMQVESADFSKYVSIVTDRATRVLQFREGYSSMERVLDFHKYPSGQAAALEAEEHFSQIGFLGNSNPQSRITPLGDEDADVMCKTELNYYYKQDGLFNVPCDMFPFWMKLMNGGFMRKGLTMVCARPKVGKSTLLAQVALHLAVAMGIPVLYLDTEMSRQESYFRSLSNLSGYDEGLIRRGVFWGQDDFARKMRTDIDGARQQLKAAPFRYINIAGKPVEYAVSCIRQFRNHMVGTVRRQRPSTGEWYEFAGPALVVYDWIKLPDADGLKNAGEHQLIGFLCSKLKDAGYQMDLPILAAAQNNRSAIGVDSEDWEEMAESFVAGSDRIAQFCNMLCILRNLNGKEADVVANSFEKRPNEEGYNALMFNQFLHVVLQRGGSDYRKGIPLYLKRGTAKYQEIEEKYHRDAHKLIQSNRGGTSRPSLADRPMNAGAGQKQEQAKQEDKPQPTNCSQTVNLADAPV